MYDALIIGAGPAGSVAALELAAAGARVALIDHRRRIGDKLCTGVIGAECADRFGVPDELIRHRARAAVIHAPGGAAYTVRRPSAQALIVDRVSYIAHVARRAADGGARLRLGLRVDAVEKTERRVSVIARDGAGKRERIDGRLLLIASGFGHALTKMAGIESARVPEHLVGCQVEVQTEGMRDTEVFVGGERVAPTAFGWLAPISPSTALLGVVARRGAQGGLERLSRDLAASGRAPSRIGAARRWGIPVKPIPKTYGDRALALGDAAGFVKPTTGGGIYYAMISGELAARAALEAMDEGDTSARSLSRYQRAWKREFGDELRVGYYARLLFEALDDRQLDLLMETFLSPEVQARVINTPDFSFDRHSRTILRAAGNARIGRLIRGFGASAAPILARLLRSAVGGG